MWFMFCNTYIHVPFILQAQSFITSPTDRQLSKNSTIRNAQLSPTTIKTFDDLLQTTFCPASIKTFNDLHQKTFSQQYRNPSAHDSSRTGATPNSEATTPNLLMSREPAANIPNRSASNRMPREPTTNHHPNYSGIVF